MDIRIDSNLRDAVGVRKLDFKSRSLRRKVPLSAAKTFAGGGEAEEFLQDEMRFSMYRFEWTLPTNASLID